MELLASDVQFMTPPPSSFKTSRKVENTTPPNSVIHGGTFTPTFIGARARNNNNLTVTSRNRRNRPSYSCTVDDATTEKEFPMFIAMADFLITPTGFTDSMLREAACSKIQLMCGEVSMAYTNRTTHILAAHANTTKVDMARKRNLPVVTIDWIENIWNACQQNNNPYIHASLPEFKINDLPVFFNLHFVFSRKYAADSKRFYETLLTTHGGFVGTCLKKASNYFYICQEPEFERMYQYAQSKEIPCVPLAWIVESIRRNEIAKDAEFEIRGEELMGFGSTFDFGEIGTDLESRPLIPTVSNVPALDATFELYQEPILGSDSFLNTFAENWLSDSGNLTLINFNTSVCSLKDFSNSTIVPDLDSSMADMSIEMEGQSGNFNNDNVCNSTFVPDPNSTLADMDIEWSGDERKEENVLHADGDGTKDNFVDSVAFSMAG